MQPAIRVENLSKRYRLGATRVDNNLTENLKAGFGRAWRGLTGTRRRERERPEASEFWALKDVSFEVKPGEVVGIIGRNGAGKSTLLKVLSRIVEPTNGRAVVRGRMGSLLEVGTGFHPELTGRENVYLNGSILGMSQKEIARKFDEIVAFSGVEKFLDTPVKRYSSGMYVRLAFAVAAHLEPEILIVDEVLAVGDAEFQRKCLGKMRDVACHGRTVLFVSHNTDAIMRLCSSAVLLTSGKVVGHMSAGEAIALYLSTTKAGGEGGSLLDAVRTIRCERSPIVLALRIRTRRGRDVRCFPTGDEVWFDIELQNLRDVQDMVCSVVVLDRSYNRVVLFNTLYHSGLLPDGSDRMTLTCRVPSLPLTPGNYLVEVGVGIGNATMLERVDQAATFDVLFDDLLGTGRLPTYHQGHIILPAEWSVRDSSEGR